MDTVGSDIAEAKFDAALLVGARTRHASVSDTEAGFGQFLAWLAKYRPDPPVPLHARMEATGNRGLDPATFPHGEGVRVGVVDPARIEAFGGRESSRHKTDGLDAALIARVRRAHTPPGRTPPAAHLREWREPVRRCEALKAARVQELNREAAGFASPAVSASIAAHLDRLDAPIEAVTGEVKRLIASDPAPRQNFAPVRGIMVRGITGCGEISAAISSAESPDIAEFTPEAPAAFAGLSPSEHSSGSSVRGSGKISRIGSRRLR